jgi:hypothetical protein
VLIDILVEDVDLPERRIRISDPELRLPRVAALDAFLTFGAMAGRLEPLLDLDELLRGADAEPDVIQVAARARLARNERQHERRLGEVELRVVGAHLGRLRAEQRPIEGDRAAEIGHVERRVEFPQSVIDCASHDSLKPSRVHPLHADAGQRKNVDVRPYSA